ncbi:MAG: asparagine synthase-related protein [Dehalococcoidia bacterium]
MKKLPKLFFIFDSKQNNLNLEISDFNVTMKKFEDHDNLLYIIGNPIIDEKINHKFVWEKIKHKINYQTLKNINGEFLIIHNDKKNKSLNIYNDRFTSIPFFYLNYDDKFIGSVFYKDIKIFLQRNNDFKINKEAIFEFLWLQRLVGEKTHDSYSKCLLAATHINFYQNKVDRYVYWTPSFKKTNRSLNESADILKNLLSDSIIKKTSDSDKNYGIFLSGGIDSRTILSLFQSQIDSYTIGVSYNNEVKVAEKIAGINNSKHSFVSLDHDPYSGSLDEIIQLGGGMYAFDHSIFYGLSDKIPEKPDVFFHGHGMDYMFQGMYLLNKNVNFLGKKTSLKKPVQISGIFSLEFLQRISYRLKGINLLDYVHKPLRSDMYDSLVNSIEEVCSNAEEFCETNDDYWEYMLIHALCRHYPYTNLLSIGTIAEQRTITFDNDVFDFYLSLDNKYRLDGMIAKKLLSKINPILGKVPVANNNFKPSMSPLFKDVTRLKRYIGRKVNSSYLSGVEANAEERTWPDRNKMYLYNKGLREAAVKLFDSDFLSSLDLFDMDILSRDIKVFIDNPNYNAGSFITFLISIERFFNYERR